MIIHGGKTYDYIKLNKSMKSKAIKKFSKLGKFFNNPYIKIKKSGENCNLSY